MSIRPGPVVLLGSGETSPNIRKVYDELFQALEAPVRIAILETPAGFEPNSDDVARQIGDYLAKRLQNYRPQISIVPARKRGTAFSPDDAALLPPLYDANVLLVGPGSPTYAARQLRDSVAWHTLQACHRLGAALIFASATTIAASRHALPVYEIYKVGEDLHWQPGLDFFGAYGLNLVFVPHWNNRDGGDALDTSHCYIGTERYEEMVTLLPQSGSQSKSPNGKMIDTANDATNGPDWPTIVGIDENTALIIDLAGGRCSVRGPGGVIIIRHGNQRSFATGEDFAVEELGAFHLPAGDAGIDSALWAAAPQHIAAAQAARAAQPQALPAVQALVDEREIARQARDWATADRLREEIEAAGWRLLDTPEGPVLEPAGDEA